MSKVNISKETYLYWYELMLKMRKFEERAGMLYGQQKIRGFLHLYIGQEAVAAGIASAIRQEDPIITAYRDHGLALAKGMSANECMAELMGKVTGCSKGKGGSMHFFSKEKYFFGGHGIVGAQIGLGTGIAFAEQYRGTDNVCVTLFGDGAAWQGVLHESFNMAKLWNLPVIYIVENNGYAMGTSTVRAAAAKDLYKIGEAFDIPSLQVDGMEPEEVYKAVKDAADLCREGHGPVFLEIKTYRYKGHSMSDPQKYRTKEEVKSYKEKDPINHVLHIIQTNNWATEAEIEEINDKVKQEIDDCVTFAENSEYPSDEAVYEDIYVQKDYPFLID